MAVGCGDMDGAVAGDEGAIGVDCHCDNLGIDSRSERLRQRWRCHGNFGGILGIDIVR